MATEKNYDKRHMPPVAGYQNPSSGIMNQRMIYASNPGNPIDRNDATTYITRTAVGSQSSHSAMPPQTPATSFLSRERLSGLDKAFPIMSPLTKVSSTISTRMG